jgi:hypothetical protein
MTRAVRGFAAWTIFFFLLGGVVRGLKPPPAFAGAEAPVIFAAFSARLKSCPDTKPFGDHAETRGQSGGGKLE